jgi:hypothetical protein
MTRRLLRILLNVVTVLSLVLCLASVGMWVRSHSYGDRWARLQYVRAGNYWQQVLSHRGVLVWAAEEPIHRMFEEGGPGPGWQHTAWGASPQYGVIHSVLWRPTWLEQWGFAYHRGPQAGIEYGDWMITPSDVLAAPYWFIAGLFALAPMLGAVRWSGLYRDGRRSRLGRCRGCGYDMRATPERCPECGRISAAKDDAAARA